MKKIKKRTICALLLMLLGILGGCGKKEAVAENENLPGEGFWDFVEQKCDSLKPDVLPEKMKLLSFYGSKDGEGGQLELEKEEERDRMWEILSDVRVLEIEEPDESIYPHSNVGVIMANDSADPEGLMRAEITIYAPQGEDQYEGGYRGFCTFHYWGEDSDGSGISCYFIQPNHQEGEPDFLEELQNWYSEIFDEIQSAFPEEGMALLDVLPEKWNTVTISRGMGEEEYSLKKEDIEKVKKILEPVHIGSQIPYGSGVVRINLTINGDQYLCWDGIIQSENPYNTKWDVTWKLDGDYGDTGYLERLEELYRTYDTSQ